MTANMDDLGACINGVSTFDKKATTRTQAYPTYSAGKSPHTVSKGERMNAEAVPSRC